MVLVGFYLVSATRGFTMKNNIALSIIGSAVCFAMFFFATDYEVRGLALLAMFMCLSSIAIVVKCKE